MGVVCFGFVCMGCASTVFATGLWLLRDPQNSWSHDTEFWLILRGSDSGSGLTQQGPYTNDTVNTKTETIPHCMV